MALLRRGAGASVGYQLASVFAGGLSPFIAVALLGAFNSYWPVALYMGFMALITIVAVCAAKETFRDEITEDYGTRRQPSVGGYEQQGQSS